MIEKGVNQVPYALEDGRLCNSLRTRLPLPPLPVLSEERRKALLRLITEAGYSPDQAAFVTAYLDRDHPAFKRTIPALAWRSLAWFLSEPASIIGLHELETGKYLSDLL